MSSPSQPLAVIAKLLDLSERRVQQLSREGVIPKATRGQYDLIGSVRGYVRYLRDQAVSAQAGAPDYAVERARFIRARADLAEMVASRTTKAQRNPCSIINPCSIVNPCSTCVCVRALQRTTRLSSHQRESALRV